MSRFLTPLLLLLAPLQTFADCGCFVTLGPEVYRFVRNREGGTHQEGRVDGVKIGFDRLKGNSFYLGADYLYARGDLKGETATGRPLQSELIDQVFEARLGFTFEQGLAGCHFITPFLGWGSFKEINQFFPPSPLPCTFTDTFTYCAVGFLSGVNFNALLSMGVNFKVYFMQKARSEVSDDPLFDHVNLMIKDEMNVRLDLPFFFYPSHTWLGMGFQLSPFFEYRHFGGREGFPFNFRDTKFYLYGAKFALIYGF